MAGIIERIAYPRAALLGNPSDGYYGKTLAFTFREFQACVRLVEAEWGLNFVPGCRDRAVSFKNPADLVEQLGRHGCSGDMRLLLAAARRFFLYAAEHALSLPPRSWSMAFESTIPQRVGLAGSSAIVTAAIRALCDFYELRIPQTILPNLILDAETRELGLPAGLQDRVAQVYGGLMFMDFDRALMERLGHGRYERLPADLLHHVFISWMPNAMEGSETPHNSLRARWEAGDELVHRTLAQIAALVEPGRRALESGDLKRLGVLMNFNFDLRVRIIEINPLHRQLIETARQAGACANFTGSGGAIVGIYEDEAHWAGVKEALAGIGACSLIPTPV